MSTFVVVHGGGDVGWSWYLVAAELRARGHEVFTPDLPADDDALTLDDYADAVVAHGKGRSWSGIRSEPSRHRWWPSGSPQISSS